MREDIAGLFWDDTPPPKILKEVAPPRTPPEKTWLLPTYLPNLEEARRFDVPRFQNWEEVRAAAKANEPLIFDAEVFKNYFCVIFTSFVSGKVLIFELQPGGFFDAQRVRWVLDNFLVIGFNSEAYDLVILALACAGRDCEALKNVSDMIIVGQEKGWLLLRGSKVKKLKCNHIDLIEVAPLSGSLKLYAGRLHAPKMQDLPFDPDTLLTEDQITIVRYYCVNDTYNTCYLFRELRPQLELRAAMSNVYGVDLRSKSDAQIAEAVINQELTRINYGEKPTKPEIDPGTMFLYKIPHYVKFNLPQLQAALEVVQWADFVVEPSGYTAMPEALKELEIKIGAGVYKMGMGGLHSSETKVAHFSDSEHKIFDRDVTSYYPSIILTQGLYPKHLGKAFLEVYGKIVNERIVAKKNKDKVKADTLKIVVNGSFGKLGNLWSTLYAPDLLIQVTMTGQLCLLMLVERLEAAGAVVLSANTDGVIYKIRRSGEQLINKVVSQWEADTGFATEETSYLGVFSRDVNNYVAVKEDRSVKVKGEYSERGSAGDSVLSKNPVNLICNDAVIGFLTKGTSIQETIRTCRDVRRFVSVRTVRGGAIKDGEYLGKVIRHYYAAGEAGEIVYAINGHKVPDTDGAKPLMSLPAALPADIDFDRYEGIAKSMLSDLGCAFV